MTTPPPARRTRETPGDAQSADAAHSPPPQERFGPLALERLHKDDGRLLIVFGEPQGGRE